MNKQPAPEQALQLLSEALEPAAQGKISRQGYIAIQQAIEVLAKLITPEPPEPSESYATND